MAATYGAGNLLTQAVFQNTLRRQTWIGYRVLGTSAIATADSLAVTIAGAHTNVKVYAASYSSVDQAAPITGSSSIYSDNATTTPQFPITTNVNPGGIAIYTWSSNQTRSSDSETYTEQDENSVGMSTGVASKAFASAATTQPTVTFAATLRGSMSLVTLNPSVVTAAAVSVSGRVVTADGAGIRNVNVMLSGASLAPPRVALTSSFGYFAFDNVDSGQTYVVSVASKRFGFAEPAVPITVIDNVADIVFTANWQN